MQEMFSNFEIQTELNAKETILKKINVSFIVYSYRTLA